VAAARVSAAAGSTGPPCCPHWVLQADGPPRRRWGPRRRSRVPRHGPLRGRMPGRRSRPGLGRIAAAGVPSIVFDGSALASGQRSTDALGARAGVPGETSGARRRAAPLATAGALRRAKDGRPSGARGDYGVAPRRTENHFPVWRLVWSSRRDKPLRDRLPGGAHRPRLGTSGGRSGARPPTPPAARRLARRRGGRAERAAGAARSPRGGAQAGAAPGRDALRPRSRAADRTGSRRNLILRRQGRPVRKRRARWASRPGDPGLPRRPPAVEVRAGPLPVWAAPARTPPAATGPVPGGT